MKSVSWLISVRIGLPIFLVCVLVSCSKSKVEDNLKSELAIDLGNGVTMEFVLIRPGSFMMGSDKPAQLYSHPAHKVKITKPFYLGKYEVTQEQWQEVVGSNPSTFKGTKNPVDNVSWNDCQDFLVKLKAKVPCRG